MGRRTRGGYEAKMRGLLVTFLLVSLASAGCASFKGWRLYSSGTQALDRGDTARAIGDLERAAELVPRASEIQNHLGLAYAAEGRDRDALLAFRRAVALDCSNLAARRNLRAAEARGTHMTDP